MTIVKSKKQLESIANSLYYFGIIKDYYIAQEQDKKLIEFIDCGIYYYKGNTSLKIFAKIED